jgi:hypothetical protein
MYEEMARVLQIKHEEFHEECRQNSERDKKRLLYDILSTVRKEIKEMLKKENLINANLRKTISERLETITQANLLDILTSHQTEIYGNIVSQIHESSERMNRTIFK